MTVLVGVIGNGVAASAELITEALSDAQAKAKKSKSDMEFKIAVEKDPSATLGTVFQWLIDEEIPYEIVIHPDIAGELGVYGDEAQKTVKSKTPTVALVDKLITEEGLALFVLMPKKDADTPNEVRSAAAKAAGAGLEVFNLTKGLADEAGMESLTFDAPDAVDFVQLGKDADEGDDDAQTTLNDLGAALDPEIVEGDFTTWVLFAKAIQKATPEPEEAAEPEETEAAPPEVNAELIDMLLEAVNAGEKATIDDDDDVDPAEALTEIGGIYELSEPDFNTWDEFAEAIKAAIAAAEDDDAAADAAAADTDAPSKWTAASVKEISDLSQLRTITVKSGAGPDAQKWNRAKCTSYLLSLGEGEGEEETKKPAKGGKAPSVAQRIEQARDQIASGVQALVNAMLDGK